MMFLTVFFLQKIKSGDKPKNTTFGTRNFGENIVCSIRQDGVCSIRQDGVCSMAEVVVCSTKKYRFSLFYDQILS